MEKIDLKELVNKRFNKCTKLESYLSISLCMLINNEDTEKAKTGKEIEVEVKLNGRKVKFSKFIEHLMNGYEKAVKEEAKEAVDNMIVDIENKVEDIVEQFTDNMDNLKEDILSEIKEK